MKKVILVVLFVVATEVMAEGPINPVNIGVIGNTYYPVMLYKDANGVLAGVLSSVPKDSINYGNKDTLNFVVYRIIEGSERIKVIFCDDDLKDTGTAIFINHEYLLSILGNQ